MKPNRLPLRANLASLALAALFLSGNYASAQQPAPPAQAEPAAQSPAGTTDVAPSAKETNCKDRIDNDADSVTDCADADCYDDAACKPTGTPETTNSLCSDFIDNDADGAIDCDDLECQREGITACQGSWKGAASAVAQPAAQTSTPLPTDVPELGQGFSVEELVGKFGDKDGERDDVVCSDGVDNDHDGRVDCADYGCRFDPSVSVCAGNPGLRFSIVSQLSQYHYFQTPDDRTPENDTRISALQLRALGPIRGIQNSFFLISMRAERTPRVTFAMFQIHIGNMGHYLNLNTGGGSLSAGLITSIAKNPMIDPPYYLYSAFEQGNGAALDIGGPIDPMGIVTARVFVGGGSGTWNGVVGGRYYSDDNRNFTYSVGTQAIFNIAGRYTRFDTNFLYTPVPLTAAVVLGGKYDRRATERYPAGNGQIVFRYGRFLAFTEGYVKRELEFDSTQGAFNVTGGFLVWPKHIYVSADFGRYISGNLQSAPQQMTDAGADVRKQRDEQLVRGAVHWYFYQNVGVLSLLYRHRDVKATRDANLDVLDSKSAYKEREGRIIVQFRF